MNKLEKYVLDFHRSFSYFKDNLSGANKMSDSIMRLVNFKDGHFFTLLPADMNVSKLLNFESGGVLSQNDLQDIFVLGKGVKGRIIPTIHAYICNLVRESILKSKYLSCIVDDYNRDPNDLFEDELFSRYGIFIDSEAYYYFDQKNFSEESMEKSLERSNTFWHSLCFLTEMTLKDISDRKLGLNTVESFSREARLILVGAYDGEGYVFWEKKC